MLGLAIQAVSGGIGHDIVKILTQLRRRFDEGNTEDAKHFVLGTLDIAIGVFTGLVGPTQA